MRRPIPSIHRTMDAPNVQWSRAPAISMAGRIVLVEWDLDQLRPLPGAELADR